MNKQKQILNYFKKNEKSYFSFFDNIEKINKKSFYIKNNKNNILTRNQRILKIRNFSKTIDFKLNRSKNKKSEKLKFDHIKKIIQVNHYQIKKFNKKIIYNNKLNIIKEIIFKKFWINFIFFIKYLKNLEDKYTKKKIEKLQGLKFLRQIKLFQNLLKVKLTMKKLNISNKKKIGKELLEKTYLMNTSHIKNIIKKNCYHILKIYLYEKIFLKRFKDKFFSFYFKSCKILMKFKSFLKIKKKFIRICLKRFDKYFKIMIQFDKESINDKKLELEKNGCVFYKTKKKFSAFLFDFYNLKDLKLKTKNFKIFNIKKIEKNILIKYKIMFQLYKYSQVKSNDFNVYFLNFSNFYENAKFSKSQLYKYDSKISYDNINQHSLIENKKKINKRKIIENTYVRFIYEIYKNKDLIGKTLDNKD